MGPIAIVDKSFFQSLSKEQYIFFSHWFTENLTSILVQEIFSDFAKEQNEDTMKKATTLAKKFGGSSGIINDNFKLLIIKSLLGNNIPLTGQIVIDHGNEVFDKEFSTKGLLVGLSPFNELLLKMADGKLEKSDIEFSKNLRKATQEFNINIIYNFLNSKRIILPKPKADSDIGKIVSDLLGNANVEDVWIDCIFSIFKIHPTIKKKVNLRWHKEKKI